MNKPFPPEILARGLRDTALTASMLADKDAPEHVEDWREHVAGLVHTLREDLRQAGAGEALIASVSYAQCALLDEAALRRLQGDQRAAWAREPLQVRFSIVTRRARLCCSRCASTWHSLAPAALSWCYAMTLALGFRGGEDEAACQSLLGRLSAGLEAPPPLPAGEFDGQVALMRGNASRYLRRVACRWRRRRWRAWRPCSLPMRSCMVGWRRRCGAGVGMRERAMRTRAHSFCLWGLSLAAASWWLTFATPWSGGLRLGAVLLAVAVWLAWIGWRLRRSSGGQTEREPVLPGLLELPQGWRGDRVTVVELESRRGAYVAAEDGVLRVMVPTPALLERVMSELVAWRRGVPPNALALRVEAAAECGESAWLGRLQAWRQAIADAEARLGCRLPLYLLVRFPAPRRCAGINGTLGVVLKGAPCSSLRQWRERLDEWRKQLELQAPGLGDGEDGLASICGSAPARWGLAGFRRCLPCCKAPRRCPPRLAGIALLPAQGGDAALSPWGAPGRP